MSIERKKWSFSGRSLRIDMFCLQEMRIFGILHWKKSSQGTESKYFP